MRLIDVAPFEKLSPVLRLSFAGRDGYRHTLVVPVEEIPTYGTRAALPADLMRVLNEGGSLPGTENVPDPVSPVLPAQGIEELDLSVRSYNCLMRANIQTLSDLLSHTEGELQQIRNMGKVSVTEIKEKLAAMGLSLKQENVF